MFLPNCDQNQTEKTNNKLFVVIHSMEPLSLNQISIGQLAPILFTLNIKKGYFLEPEIDNPHFQSITLT